MLPLLKNEALFRLIPQRPPMVMLDYLLEANAHRAVTGFCVKKEHLFVQNGRFQEAGLIENMAQTAACQQGYLALQTGNNQAPMGYIGSIKNLKIEYLPHTGDELTTTAITEREVMSFLVISSKIECRSRLVASCEMKIFIKKA